MMLADTNLLLTLMPIMRLNSVSLFVRTEDFDAISNKEQGRNHYGFYNKIDVKKRNETGRTTWRHAGKQEAEDGSIPED